MRAVDRHGALRRGKDPAESHDVRAAKFCRARAQDHTIVVIEWVTPDLATHAVEEFMTTGLVTVHEDVGIKEVLETLSHAGIRRVPVVDGQGDLVGIVSMDDIAVLLADGIEDVADVVRKQSPRF